MSSIVASVSEESEDSLTIQFSGQPANALSSAPGVFEDLDWNHELVVDWSGENIQCTLNYQHDGFPFHDIRINEEIVYQFDPIENDQTPLSLAGTGSGEWQDSVDCSEALK
jgi:outer membrane protease